MFALKSNQIIFCLCAALLCFNEVTAALLPRTDQLPLWDGKRLISLAPGQLTWISEDLLNAALEYQTASVQEFSRYLNLHDGLQREFEQLPVPVQHQLLSLGLRALGPGFVDYTSNFPGDLPKSIHDESLFFSEPVVNLPKQARHQSLVRSQMRYIKPDNLYAHIDALSNGFKTRHQKSSLAIPAANWVRDKFEEIAKKAGRLNDVDIQLFHGKSTKQPSVIVTLKGSTHPSEVVVVGAHEDSISSRFDVESRAPGADDDASGLACVLELYRVLLESPFQPNRTVQFMAFAAEEGGLLGSKDIARAYRANNVNVVSMLQMEMAGYVGRNTLTIMQDTNDAMASYMKMLADEYIHDIPAARSNCGYGCSDHYSFHAEGYPSIALAEAGPSGPKLNPNIHTVNDTLDKLSMEFLANFARLGLAYVVEAALLA